MAGAFWDQPSYAAKAAAVAQQGGIAIVDVTVEAPAAAVSASGFDVSGAAPAAVGVVLATFTVLNAGEYWIQNQSSANLQVWFDDGFGNQSTVQILPFGAGPGLPGGDTGGGIRWFTGRIRVVGPAGSQFAARHN